MYRKENWCFRCGEQGHNYRNYPKKTQGTPQVAHILSNHDDEVPSSSQLLYTWGRVRDQSAFILLDPSSTHNIILDDLAQKLGINAKEMGPPLQALGAFEDQQVLVTPLIGKLCLHIQNYNDSEDFYISPLVYQDVILGMPWFHHLYTKTQFPKKVATFTHYGKEYSIKAQSKGNTISLVNGDAIKKVIKKSLFAYIIHVKDSPSPCVNDNSMHDNVSTQVYVNDDDLNHSHFKEFLHK